MYYRRVITLIAQPRLDINVQSFCQAHAPEIALEILACGNDHFQMGHRHLVPLLSSQSVSRGHEGFNLKRWYPEISGQCGSYE